MKNTYELDEEFIIDEDTARENYGTGVKVHIGLGQADIVCEKNFDALTSHKPGCDTYLRQNNRQADIVSGEMVGLAFRNGGRLEGAVIISLPIS